MTPDLKESLVPRELASETENPSLNMTVPTVFLPAGPEREPLSEAELAELVIPECALTRPDTALEK